MCAREAGGGLCGATPSFPFFAFYDDIFFGVSFIAFGIQCYRMFVLRFGYILNSASTTRSMMILLAARWLSELTWTLQQINNHSQFTFSVLVFSVDFRISYTFNFFFLLVMRLFVSFSILFLAHLRCDEVTLNAWFVFCSLLDFTLYFPSHLLYSQTGAECTHTSVCVLC